MDNAPFYIFLLISWTLFLSAFRKLTKSWNYQIFEQNDSIEISKSLILKYPTPSGNIRIELGKNSIIKPRN